MLARRWPRLRGWLEQSGGRGRPASPPHAGRGRLGGRRTVDGRPVPGGPPGRPRWTGRPATRPRWARSSGSSCTPASGSCWPPRTAAADASCCCGSGWRPRWSVAVLAVAVATFAVVQQLRADAAAGRADAARVAAAAPPSRTCAWRCCWRWRPASSTAGSPAPCGPSCPCTRPHRTAGGGRPRPSPSARTGQRSPPAPATARSGCCAPGSLEAGGRARRGPAPVNGLTFTADGRRLVGWGGGGRPPARSGIAVWDLGSRRSRSVRASATPRSAPAAGSPATA